MKRLTILMLACGLTAACSTPDSIERHRQTCSAYGHSAGSPELASCVERKSQESEAQAGQVGTSILTRAIFSAI